MKKNKKIIMGTFTGAAVIAMPIITVVSCGHKKDETIIRKPKYSNNQKVDLASLIREKNQKFIYENDDDSNPILDYKKIKIVSLGDSVSAGYSQLDEKDHRGYSNNGKISGISYGSYIARALNKNNKLSEFNNFGIGGATTDTLRSQLDPKYKLNGNSETRSNLINAKLVFPEKGEKERFTKIQEKLREADFVTISIGANDILYSLKIGGLTINEILAKGTDKINMSGGINSLITYDKKEFNAAVKKAQNNLMAIISRIKSFNSKVKIVIVGYPMPITQLSSIIKIVRDSDGCSLAEKLLKTLDGIGGRIANQFNTVDFIDGYIENTWDKNSITLAPELLDIHPGARGYKMIAATILSRLTGITNTKIDERNAFLPTDSKVRLKGFYGDSIKEYTDINFPLTKEEEKVDGLAKPYKLFRFATNLIAKIVRTNNASNSLTTDLIKNYGNTSMADNAKYLFPFIKQLFKSAELGLNSNEEIVKKGVEQDIKFIIASFLNIASKFKTGIPTDPNSIYGLMKIFVPEISNGGMPLIKKLLDANMDANILNEKAIKNIIANGPAKDYLKQ